jgi:general stress protein 26
VGVAERTAIMGRWQAEAMSELDDIKADATRLSSWAHIATVGSDGKPDVAPVHPAWESDDLWVMVFAASVKAKNIVHNPDIAMHWQVTEAGDGVEVWGTAAIHDDLETKRRLWDGMFDYDLNLFSPGGPDGSPDTVFLQIEVERAVSIKAYGMGGFTRWSRASSAS